METRSRKRVEATTHRPSTATPARASKRARHSAAAAAGAGASSASGAGTAPNPPPRTRPSTRTSTAAAAAASTGQTVGRGMETGAEAVPSGSRRDREKSSSRRESDRGFVHPLDEDEEERGIAERLEREMEKGKEKEAEKENDRVRERSEGAERIERAERAERDKAASTAASSGDDDNEGDGGSNFNQNLASASSALHGLLRKLGAGLDDLMPLTAPSAHQSSKLKRILSGLRAEGEDDRQLEALSQLCELLSIGTEESLSSFSVDSFVPVLVGLLNYEYSPDIMLLAARALTHLCDVLPSSCAAVVHYGAVPCFCARLLTIEYIDLAEQSLQALEKISHEHPTACLRAGALMAVLSYLDFFSTGVQRVAVTTAANMCRQLPSDAADFVTEAVPLLTNLLQYQDSKVVEHASVCLSRIAETFGSSSEKLDMLCAHGLIPQVARLISVSNSSASLVPQASLSSSTYTGLIRLLSTCASGSAGAAESLLLLRISSILKDVLAGSGLVSSTSGSGLSVNRPPEQLYEIVTLVNELLPALPDGQGVPVGSSSSGGSGSRGGRKYSGLAIANKTEEGGGAAAGGPSAREILLREQPELLEQFSNDLFPVLVQVYGSSVNPPVRHKCLAAINKLVYFSTPEMLRSLLHESNISSFLAGVLGSKDMSLLTMALQIAEMLMQKLPDVFVKMFVKEGVVHALDTLIASAGVGAASPLPGNRPGELAANAVVTASGGILPPARPRRGGASRRKSMGSADEEGGLSTSAPAGTVASPPSGEPLRAIRLGLRASAIAQAKKIRETHFPGDAGTADEGVTESLRKLKGLCAQLKGENGAAGAEMNKGKGKGKARGGSGGSAGGALSEDQLGVVVGELLAELGAGDGVSTFEFVGSGVVGSLIHYFSCGNTSKEKVDDAGLREQAVRRLKQFIEVALPREGRNGVRGAEAPLTLLVRKLQNALASLERFPVVLSHAPRSSSGTASIAAGLSALTQPFKLRLCRATGDKMLRDYSTNVVLIEPLATLVAVEDFLWPRVKRQEAAAASGAGASTSEASAPIAVPGAERRSTRSRSVVGAAGAGSGRSSESGLYLSGGANASGSKGKGKAVSRSLGSSPGGEDSRGPETRNAAARRRAAAAAAAVTAASVSAAAKAASEGDSEEDVDVSPVELEEAVAMDEDDLSEDEDEDEDDDHDDVFGDDPVASCKGERVHDVQLGDPEGGAVASSSEVSQPSGGVSVVSRTGASASGGAEASGIRTMGARGSLSYAAAALANARENGSRSCGRERKSLAAAAAANLPPKLVFSLGGKPLNRMLTIFQAIQRQAVAEDDEDERYARSEHPSGGGRRLWDEVYTITYQRAEASGEAGGCGNGKGGSAIPSGKGCSSAMEGSWQQTSLVDNTLTGELPCDLDRSNNTYEILVLLRVLEGLNRLTPRLRSQGAAEAFARGEVDRVSESPGAGPVVPREEFLSSKLTPKLARQMQDALALCSGGLPAWCGQLTRACPFLFPFETRRQCFHSTAFGLSRALQRLQAQQSAEGAGGSSEHRELRVGRLQRQKVRVSRQRILDSAAKVMELYAGHKAVLEVEYFGEVGTGLGPTLEFYTLLSHELQKEKLEMWRTEMRSKSEGGVDVEMAVAEERGEAEVASSSGDYVSAPQGLFPRPWHPETDASSNKKYGKVLEHFRLLGRVMAKALQDGRLLDVPLSTALYKIVLGQELDLYDIEMLDPELGRTLFEMQVLVRRKQFLEASGQEVDGLRFRGSRVEDLCLDFTLPGYPEYELKSKGRDVTVELENLEEYISLVVEATVKGGIGAQIEAFRAGFNQVFQLSCLQIFSEDELEYLLCGRRELWASESLPDIMKFDHGYTAASPPIRNLLDIMSELTPDEQRAFLRFVTGAPRLPPGGLAALNPKLTIVRKHPIGGTGTALGTTPPGPAAGMGTTLADRDLPSVMTCANYLKLPPYSCKEVMRERLMYAICEGQGSFDLS